MSELEELCQHAVGATTKPRLSTEPATLVLACIAELRVHRAQADGTYEWSTVLRRKSDGHEEDRELEPGLTDCRNIIADWYSDPKLQPEYSRDAWDCIIQKRTHGGDWVDHH